MKQFLSACCFLFCYASTAQVAISNDGTAPHGSAQLEIKSANRGLLLPRVNTSAISNPAEGLVVYNNSNDHLSYFNGSNWNNLSTGQGLTERFPNTVAFQGGLAGVSPTYTEFSWLVPAGITKLWIEAWAGGDPGRAVPSDASATDGTSGSTFAGGDAGDYGSFTMDVTPGETLTLRVGKGGVSSGSSTTNGGNTSIITTASPARNYTIAHQAYGIQYAGLTANTIVPGAISYVAGEAGHIPNISFAQTGATQYRRIYSEANGGDSYPGQKGGKGTSFVFDAATGDFLIGGLISVVGRAGAAPGAGGGASIGIGGSGGPGMVIVHW